MTAENIKIQLSNAFNQQNEEIKEEEEISSKESNFFGAESSVPMTSSTSRRKRKIISRKIEEIEISEILKGEKGEILWKCLICGRETNWKSRMKKHVLTHTNVSENLKN